MAGSVAALASSIGPAPTEGSHDDGRSFACCTQLHCGRLLPSVHAAGRACSWIAVVHAAAAHWALCLGVSPLASLFPLLFRVLC